jgi:hypothetical protein
MAEPAAVEQQSNPLDFIRQVNSQNVPDPKPIPETEQRAYVPPLTEDAPVVEDAPPTTPAATEVKPDDTPASTVNFKELLGEDAPENMTLEQLREFYKKGQGHGELETKYNELSGKYAELSELEKYIENPFASPEIAEMNKAAKVLNVTDGAFIKNITTATAENLTANPIHALALAEVLKDTSLLGSNSMEDYIALATAELEKNGYEEGQPVSGAAKIMLSRAINDVLAKQQEIKNQPESNLSGLKEKLAAERTKFSETVQANTELAIKANKDKVLEGIKKNTTFKHGDAEYNLLADNKDAATIVEQTITQLVAGGAKLEDVTPEMIQYYAESALVQKNGGLQGLLTRLVGQLEGKIKENLDLSVHNGQAVAKPAAPGAASQEAKAKSFVDGVKSEFYKPKVTA